MVLQRKGVRHTINRRGNHVSQREGARLHYLKCISPPLKSHTKDHTSLSKDKNCIPWLFVSQGKFLCRTVLLHSINAHATERIHLYRSSPKGFQKNLLTSFCVAKERYFRPPSLSKKFWFHKTFSQGINARDESYIWKSSLLRFETSRTHFLYTNDKPRQRTIQENAHTKELALSLKPPSLPQTTAQEHLQLSDSDPERSTPSTSFSMRTTIDHRRPLSFTTTSIPRTELKSLSF